MYDELLKNLEENLSNIWGKETLDETCKVADLIIKIKTIQALDTSADLIRESRGISKN